MAKRGGFGSIGNICSRTPEYGNITHPTQTFITLRTIGWNRHEIRTRKSPKAR